MIRRSIRHPATIERPAMTLTELMVVIGIIVVVIGFTIPALSVWEARKVQDAINLSNGMLQTVQTAAMTQSRTMGLFFFVEPESQTQYAWPIEPDVDLKKPDLTADRFKLMDRAPFKLPKPMRVVPVSVLDTTLLDRLYWSLEQLDKNDHRINNPSDPCQCAPNPEYDSDDPKNTGTQFHRNFFVILFDNDGRVITNRQVFIFDQDLSDNPIDGEHSGFRTGVEVSGDDAVPPQPPNVIIDDNGIGSEIRFLTARGILIYDDEKYQVTPFDTRRDYLRQMSQPLYIHAVSGKIIKGQPAGVTS